jgi:bla regulator protein BlaR1
VISPALNHVWQSTVFCGAVALLAWALRRYPARVRFWLWTSASLKFLVPFAVLAMAGTGFSPRTPAPFRGSAIQSVVQPFVPAADPEAHLSPLGQKPTDARSHTWTKLLFILWATGFAATLGWWTLQALRVIRTIRSARPADDSLGHLPITVRLTDSSIQPGVFGMFRPVLLMPAGIAARLSPAQLQAVVAHELIHVRRRDNLWAALHSVVQAIFWFHPLVWWLGGRLLAERELACDEAVLDQGADAEGYAAGILEVCRFYACAPRAYVSGVAGADLQQRIRAIMKFSGAKAISQKMRLGLAGLAAMAVAAPFIPGNAIGLMAQDAPKLSFDAAAIHEWGPGQGPSGTFAAGLQVSPGRIRSQCANLKSMIFFAYHLTGSEPLEGVPKWGAASCGYPDSAETFTVDAVMPGNTTDAQSRQMMQTLLAERFKLTAHWETRQMPTYALRTVPGKSKLKPSDPTQDPPRKPGSVACPEDDRGCHMWCCGSATIAGMIGMLSNAMGRPVIDKTGLSGTYYFDILRWPGEQSVNSSLPPLPALLREQFGLELKAEPGPVPVLVIDHVEKPTAN